MKTAAEIVAHGIKNSEEAAKMSSEALKIWLIEEVWANYKIDSIQSAIISEIAERLHPEPEEE